MKLKSLTIVAILLAVAHLLMFVDAPPVSPYLPAAQLGLSLLLVLLAVFCLTDRRSPETAAAPAAEPVPVVPVPPPVNRDERAKHELTALLGQLQEKGRLVDFVMEELHGQPDERVGQVARVVHAGCREVILRAFDPQPIQAAPEGTLVSPLAGTPPAQVRWVGAGGGAPDQGRVLHRGWRAARVALPEFSSDPTEGDGGYVIAPAELERS